MKKNDLQKKEENVGDLGINQPFSFMAEAAFFFNIKIALWLLV
jgi:hypothetical protein